MSFEIKLIYVCEFIMFSGTWEVFSRTCELLGALRVEWRCKILIIIQAVCQKFFVYCLWFSESWVTLLSPFLCNSLGFMSFLKMLGINQPEEGSHNLIFLSTQIPCSCLNSLHPRAMSYILSCLL